MGREALVADRVLSLGGDDFARFQEEIPGVYAYLGSSSPEKLDTCRALPFTEIVKWSTLALLGPGLIPTVPALRSGATPGVYAYLGSSSPEKPDTCRPLHNEKFDLEEAALPIGAARLVESRSTSSRAKRRTR